MTTTRSAGVGAVRRLKFGIVSVVCSGPTARCADEAGEGDPDSWRWQRLTSTHGGQRQIICQGKVDEKARHDDTYSMSFLIQEKARKRRPFYVPNGRKCEEKAKGACLFLASSSFEKMGEQGSSWRAFSVTFPDRKSGAARRDGASMSYHHTKSYT